MLKKKPKMAEFSRNGLAASQIQAVFACFELYRGCWHMKTAVFSDLEAQKHVFGGLRHEFGPQTRDLAVRKA